MSFEFAYLDPGTGSLIIQAVVGGLVAGSVIFRTQLSRLARAVRRGLGR